ncbi:hypothetical protein BGZ75_006013 [Mortierella antarctica]|nr:hypothetical protein BGZ75_006013 [Mortierella antarctica]
MDSKDPPTHIEDDTFSCSSSTSEISSSLDTLAIAYEMKRSTSAMKEEKDKRSLSFKELRPALTTITFKVLHGSLTACMSLVGKGKSSLVSAIIQVQIRGWMVQIQNNRLGSSTQF